MDDNKLIAWVITTVGTILVVLILSITGFYAHKDYRIAKVLSSGIDPVGASLAFTDPYESKMTLYLLAKNAK